MFASTEKAIHFVGKTTVGLLALLLCVCVGYEVYRIREFRQYEENVIVLSEEVDDAREENIAEPIPRTDYLQRIKDDWDKNVEHQALRKGVFYER